MRTAHEGSALLSPYERREDVNSSPASPSRKLYTLVVLSVVVFAFAAVLVGAHSTDIYTSTSFVSLLESITTATPILGNSKDKDFSSSSNTVGIDAAKRCDWVQQSFVEKDVNLNAEEKKNRYLAQSVDSNVFFRATAHIFWQDFSRLGNFTRSTLEKISLHDGLPLSPKSTYTWVTGDQHLSNFGAWRNRNAAVVYSVNDFDEGAIYDFMIDVLRIAVSIFNHAITNQFSDKVIDKALHVFTDSYVDTVMGYVGNEDALLFEMTSKTAKGELKDFLQKVESKKSTSKQLQKFTNVDETGVRYFIKGDVNVPHEETNLADVPPEIDAQIKQAFSSTRYGATMMKLGWNVREWDDDYFTVLDVAERIGSGIGSLGVDRYYVLLKGTDGLLGEEDDGSAVILDVKAQPLAAVERVLNLNDAAWYKVLFSNAAARVVEAQRRLTSYVDPFTGWILLEDEDGVPQPFSIRQRSPWKDAMDLEDLTKAKDFYEFVSQIATVTATSHVRGSVAKPPADFKHVIQAIMERKSNRKEWGKAVATFAHAYHEQVLLDFECFQEFVKTTYGDEASSQ